MPLSRHGPYAAPRRRGSIRASRERRAAPIFRCGFHHNGLAHHAPIVVAALAPIALLCLSNVFVTLAWYGHLKLTDRPLWDVVLASWRIAPIECSAVPASRYGSPLYAPAQLKTMQGVTTLVVFAAFLCLKASFTLNHPVGFALHGAGRVLRLQGRALETGADPSELRVLAALSGCPDRAIVA